MSTNTSSGRKMASTVTCQICKKRVDSKNTMHCSECHNYYEFECSGYSQKLFRLKDADSRKQWKCKTCENKIIKNSNVTMRKKLSPANLTAKITHSSSQSSPKIQSCDLTDLHLLTPGKLSDSPEKFLSRSMEHIPTETVPIHEMKDTIEMLKAQLASSQNELDTTLMENYDLKTVVSKLNKENNTLKLLCQSPLPENNLNLRHPMTTVIRHQNTTFTPPRRQTNSLHGELVVNLQRNIIDLKQELKEAQDEIMKLKDKLSAFENKLESSCVYSISQEIECRDITNPTFSSEYTQTMPDSIPKTPLTSQIMILSNIKRRDIVSTAKSLLPEHQICHYLYEGGHIQQMIEGLEKKLEAFTQTDYCILMIGEHDFKVTKNYSLIVENIREKILSVQHTNVIIMLPTFKCFGSVTLYNKRLESFNNLLYLDNEIYQYAYIMDSNKNLSYSHKMFSYITHHINNYALNVIFRDVSVLILQIKRQEQDASCELDNSETENSNHMFFRS
ncbi:hypothetical protein JYU34_011859 [Plutella xylostella]|uniref:PHD-type domain-containing protein n=1 Tax=Plutella xylostella TaxID=51655 RepID=A0ABQ7QHE9_PLUXY|nr:hypothetical protein JYU34_011859 [Plutella xylostella]